MHNVAAIIYTASSDFAKGNIPALREVVFCPVISWVNEALKEVEINERCYVIEKEEEKLSEFTKDYPVLIREENSGHPTLCAKDWILNSTAEHFLILSAEAVFTNAQVLKKSLEQHIEQNAKLTVIASGGREALMKEIGISSVWATKEFLLELIDASDKEGNGEQFVVSAMKIISDAGKVAGTYVAGKREINMRAKTAEELLNINAAARTLIFKKLCNEGVEFTCLDGIIIEPTVKIKAGTKILPGTILKGKTEIGENCVIGPNSLIENGIIMDDCEVNSTQIHDSTLERNVKIGPFSQIRPGCLIHEGCKIGDFVEIKNSEVGARTAVAHLTYIGDATVGEAVNFGCGCCIANYDGQHKHHTTIGNHAFLGCNTNLVAPVELEDFAYTAAGTTITKDVPEYALAVGRAKQQNIEDWVKAHDAIKIK